MSAKPAPQGDSAIAGSRITAIATFAAEAQAAAEVRLNAAMASKNPDTALWVMELRRRAKMSTTAYAKALGVAESQVFGWEQGKIRPAGIGSREKLTALGDQYTMPPLPEGRLNQPYFSPSLESAFAEMFGSGN